MFKVTIKTLKRRQWRRSGAFFCSLWPYFAPCSSVFIVNFEQVNVSWVREWNITFIEICISKVHPKWNYQESNLLLLTVSSAKVYDSQNLKLKFSLWSLWSHTGFHSHFQITGKNKLQGKNKRSRDMFAKISNMRRYFFQKMCFTIKIWS